MSETCKSSMLTRKAVEYYEEQGLVCPVVLENGYRDFSRADVERLKKIAVLRRLGLSVRDIREALDERSGAGLHGAAYRKQLEIDDLKSRQELAQKLARDYDWEYARQQLDTLEKKQSVLERLMSVFPGYYGKFVSLHFAQYLGEPITTNEQQEAFNTLMAFLDSVDLAIPDDLREYLDEITRGFDTDMAASISDNLNKAIQNTEQYIEDNKETLEQYMAFKDSDAYRQSSAYRLNEVFTRFHSESGYYDIFIPAMQRLSRSYRTYYEAMQEANRVFLHLYPGGQ
ncbi:MAG TPA: MerR family transcriptional regulator [Feifaniaceae bacterium]|nr:MerR family transcriptional regulator [Feifaniaceae bacterium]